MRIQVCNCTGACTKPPYRCGTFTAYTDGALTVPSYFGDYTATPVTDGPYPYYRYDRLPSKPCAKKKVA
jgi:hypothetical protein